MAIGLQLGGGGLLVDGLRNANKALLSRNWPTTVGRVVRAEPRGSSTLSISNPWAFDPGIKYQYTVEGVTYTGDRVSFGRIPSTAEGVGIVLMQYPVGASVTVWYDPDDPDRAVLEPGASGDSWAEAALGLILVITGLIVQFAARAT